LDRLLLALEEALLPRALVSRLHFGRYFVSHDHCVAAVCVLQTMKEKDAKGRKGMKRKGRLGDGDDHSEGRGFAVAGLRTGKFQKKGHRWQTESVRL